MKQHIKKLALYLIFSSLTYSMEQTNSVIPQQKNGYAEIANYALETENFLEDSPIDPKVKAEDKANALLLIPADNELRRLTFKLFGQADSRPFTSILQPYSLREINVIIGEAEDKEAHLLHKLDKTKTISGKTVLTRLLSEPLNSLEILKNRQEALKYLIDISLPLKSTLDESFKKIQNNEKMLLNSWNRAAILDSELAKQVYPPDFLEKYKTSPTICEALRKAKYTGATLATIGSVLSVGFMGWQTKKLLNFFKQGHVKTKQLATMAGLTIGTTAIYGYGLYQTKNQIDALNYISRCLYKRMYPIAQFFKELEIIYATINLYGKALIPVIPHYQALKDFCEGQNISPTLSALKQLLNSSTFAKENANWTTRFGDAAAAYALLEECKQETLPILLAIGTIDAYRSIAQVFIEQETKSNKYCFVQYISSDQPELSIKGLYNPLLPENAIKACDVTISSNERPNIILTGPHGGGKSTYMKAIAYSIILAQTFGIIPAIEGKLTLFDKLYTYSNIKEQIGQGYSTFMAEQKRLNDIKTMLKTKTSKSFTLIDEPLKGTMEVEGAIRINRFLNETIILPHSLLILATHFEKPTQLAGIHPNRLAIAHPELLENHDGTFTRTFKILSGNNDWWFNDADKRERYIDWLTNL